MAGDAAPAAPAATTATSASVTAWVTAEREVGPGPRRRRTFPASDLRRPAVPAVPTRDQVSPVPDAMPEAVPPAVHRGLQTLGRAASDLRVDDSARRSSQEVSLPLDDVRDPTRDDMVVYRKALGTPTLTKMSALDLMSKEFSAAAGADRVDGAVPRVANDRIPSMGELRAAAALDRFNPRARLSSHQEEQLLLEAPHRDSFRSALRLPVLIGQCFSLLPTSSQPDIVPRFSFTSPRFLYSAVVTFGLFFMTGLDVVYVIQKQHNEENSITAWSSWVFYFSTGTVSLLYLRLAVQWRSLCLCFRRVEHVMKSVGYPPRLRQRFHFTTVTVLSLALLEYTLAVSQGIYAMGVRHYTSFHDFFRDYYAGSFSHLLLLFPYSPMTLLLVQSLNVVATLMWNYNDLFIMLVSIAIAQRFKLLNQKLQDGPREEKTPAFWRRAREMYNALAVLTREVDRILCVQILFSFMNNLYFICIQLLRTVKQESNSTLQSVYFTYSFGFLLVRTASVSLFAASINDESKNVKKILYSVSSGNYCEEVDRFIIQATTDEIALTGLKFFSVTRSFLLTVAGTIATYEIVLVQFNGNKKVT